MPVRHGTQNILALAIGAALFATSLTAVKYVARSRAEAALPIVSAPAESVQAKDQSQINKPLPTLLLHVENPDKTCRKLKDLSDPTRMYVNCTAMLHDKDGVLNCVVVVPRSATQEEIDYYVKLGERACKIALATKKK